MPGGAEGGRGAPHGRVGHSVSHFAYLAQATGSDVEELSVGTGVGTGFYVVFVRHLAGSSGVGDTYMVLGYVRNTGNSKFSVVGSAPSGTTAALVDGSIKLSWPDGVWPQAWLFRVA